MTDPVRRVVRVIVDGRVELELASEIALWDGAAVARGGGGGRGGEDQGACGDTGGDQAADTADLAGALGRGGISGGGVEQVLGDLVCGHEKYFGPLTKVDPLPILNASCERFWFGGSSSRRGCAGATSYRRV